jgi:hypothetical protein
MAVLANSLVPLVTAAPDRVGHPSLVYIDPEFEPGGTRIVFQDTQYRAWVGFLDPATGKCLSATCRDVLVATDLQRASDFTHPFNGPEWGVSGTGSSVHLTKYAGETLQSWLVLPDGSELTQLTFAQEGTSGSLASIAPSASAVRVIVGLGPTGPDLKAAWFDTVDGTLNLLPGFWWDGQTARFLPGSARIAIYPWRNNSDYQLAIVDTERFAIQVVTAGTGQKFEPYGFIWRSRRYAATLLDRVSLVVYQIGSPPWPQVAILTPPVPGWLFSLEPVGDTGCFTVALQNAPDQSYTDAAIYLACLNGAWIRIDDQASPVRRSEPEPWRSPNGQWFVYWNEGSGGLWVVPIP